jgi:hypothetical protein
MAGRVFLNGPKFTMKPTDDPSAQHEYQQLHVSAILTDVVELYGRKYKVLIQLQNVVRGLKLYEEFIHKNSMKCVS